MTSSISTTDISPAREAAKLRDTVVGWRRYLHQNPELSFHEEQTAQWVFERLSELDGLEISRPTKTSVAARLIGLHPGPVIAMRADMDALPITELNEVEYASRNPGVMHACGHDGHTSMLLGAATILTGLRDRLHGEVRFIFQHAEELYPGGAQEMVDAGVMDGVDIVIGAHLWLPMEYGKVGVRAGALMAAPDVFRLIIRGAGGHAALPHETVDSIAVAARQRGSLGDSLHSGHHRQRDTGERRAHRNRPHVRHAVARANPRADGTRSTRRDGRARRDVRVHVREQLSPRRER
jgi:amidohydrolase